VVGQRRGHGRGHYLTAPVFMDAIGLSRRDHLGRLSDRRTGGSRRQPGRRAPESQQEPAGDDRGRATRLSRLSFSPACRYGNEIWSVKGRRMTVHDTYEWLVGINWSLEAITAAATIGLAVLTAILALGSIVLWRSTKRLVTSAERTSEQQLRAYVLPDYSDLVDGTTLTPPQPDRANIPGGSIWIKNFGQTPAYEVRSWSDITVELVANESRLVAPGIAPLHAITVGPGGSFLKNHWFNRPITPPEIAEINRGIRGIYVYGRIEYKDAYGKNRFCDFRLCYTNSTYPPIGSGIFVASESGNASN